MARAGVDARRRTSRTTADAAADFAHAGDAGVAAEAVAGRRAAGAAGVARVARERAKVALVRTAVGAARRPSGGTAALVGRGVNACDAGRAATRATGRRARPARDHGTASERPQHGRRGGTGDGHTSHLQHPSPRRAARQGPGKIIEPLAHAALRLVRVRPAYSQEAPRSKKFPGQRVWPLP
jgi:hypothetical protein